MIQNARKRHDLKHETFVKRQIRKPSNDSQRVVIDLTSGEYRVTYVDCHSPIYCSPKISTQRIAERLRRKKEYNLMYNSDDNDFSVTKIEGLEPIVTFSATEDQPRKRKWNITPFIINEMEYRFDLNEENEGESSTSESPLTAINDKNHGTIYSPILVLCDDDYDSIIPIPLSAYNERNYDTYHSPAYL